MYKNCRASRVATELTVWATERYEYSCRSMKIGSCCGSRSHSDVPQVAQRNVSIFAQIWHRSLSFENWQYGLLNIISTTAEVCKSKVDSLLSKVRLVSFTLIDVVGNCFSEEIKPDLSCQHFLIQSRVFQGKSHVYSIDCSAYASVC